jgi:hypothetical protein
MAPSIPAAFPWITNLNNLGLQGQKHTCEDKILKWQIEHKLGMIAASAAVALMSAFIGACLATAPMIRSGGEPRNLSGAWLMTLALPGRRPLETVVTFIDSPASADEQPGDGQWARTSANRFRISFRLPEEESDAISGGEYWAAGVLMLNELGQLRGPLDVELHNSTGRLAGPLRGIAKATPVPRWRKVEKIH